MSTRLGRMEPEGVRIVGEFPGPDCVVLARTDYDVCAVEVPSRLPAQELEAAVRFRLREVYPGQDEGSLLDLVSYRLGDTLRVVSSIVSPEVMTQYRAVSGEAPVVPAVRLLRRLKGVTCALLVGPDWGELVEIDTSGILGSRLVHAGARDLGNAIPDHLTPQTQPGPRALLLLGDPKDVEAARQGLGADVQPIRNGHVPRHLNRKLRPAPFTAPTGRARLSRLVLDLALIAGLAGSLAFAIASPIARRTRELDRIQAELQTLEGTTAEYERLKAVMSGLPSRVRTPDPATVGALLSELALSLPADTAITLLSYEAPVFRVEASSAEPLRIPALLAERPRFQAIRVEAVVKRQDGDGFRFVLHGRFQ